MKTQLALTSELLMAKEMFYDKEGPFSERWRMYNRLVGECQVVVEFDVDGGPVINVIART